MITVCFITTSLDIIDIHLLLRLCTTCQVLYKVLNMSLWQVSLVSNPGNLIGFVFVTSSGAPNTNVADSLDSAYFGTMQSFITWG